MSCLLILLMACGPNKNNYYLLTDSGDGISKTTTIHYKGVQVGSITGIDFAQNKIKLTLSTEPNFKISKTAIVYMENSKMIISKANDENVYANGATITQNLDQVSRLEAKGKNMEKFVIDMIDTMFTTVGKQVLDEMRQEFK
jgi:hypothetical protein